MPVSWPTPVPPTSSSDESPVRTPGNHNGDRRCLPRPASIYANVSMVRSAVTTTGSSSIRAGRSSNSRTARSSGPTHRVGNTSPSRLGTRSEQRRLDNDAADSEQWLGQRRIARVLHLARVVAGPGEQPPGGFPRHLQASGRRGGPAFIQGPSGCGPGRSVNSRARSNHNGTSPAQ